MTTQRIEMQGQGAAEKIRMTYTEFLDNSALTQFHWLLLSVVLISEILDGMDFQIVSLTLPSIIKNFHLNPAQAGAVPSASNFGLMAGTLLFSVLSDRIGRKPILQWVILTFSVGSLLSALAPTYHTLLAARFLAGLGIGAELPIGATILAEFAPKRYRHIFVGLVPLVWSIGWIIAALLSIHLIPVFGWRSMYLVGVVPAVLIGFVRYILPESVRFLLSRGRTEEAGAVVRDIARRGGITNVELVPPQMAESQVRLTFRQQLALLRTVRGPLLALTLLFFCYYIENWGVNAWLPTFFVRQGFTMIRSFKYTLTIFCVTPFAMLFGSWFQDKVNRKWALFSMTLIGTVFFVLFGMSFNYRWPVSAMLGSEMLQIVFGHGVVAILYTLSAESFPTAVRGFGMGISQAIGRFGAALGPLFIGLLLKFGMATGHVVYCFSAPMVIATALGLFIIRFDPRQRTLEQVALAAEVKAVVATAD